jgi:predicted nucleic acid-binding protein
MNVDYFLDTNIFVYSFDQSAPSKQTRALALIQDAVVNGAGATSSQVVQEFLSVATRKFAVPFTLEDSQTYLQRVLHPLCRTFTDMTLLELSLEVQAETGYSFYDSLIVAGAVTCGCRLLFTEDLQHSREVRGVLIRNPFAE